MVQNLEKRLSKRIIRAIKANHSRNRSLITFYKLVVLSNLFQIDLQSFLKTNSKLIKLDHNSLNRFKIFSQKRNPCLNILAQKSPAVVRPYFLVSTGPMAQACYMTHAAYNLLHTVCNMPHILSMIELILLESHRYWTVNLDLAGHHTNYNLTAWNHTVMWYLHSQLFHIKLW